MNLQRKVTLVVTTGAIALGAGHYVQENAANRSVSEPKDVVVSSVMPVAAGPEVVAVPVAPPVTETVADPVAEDYAALDVEAPAPPPVAVAPTPPVAEALDCAISLDLSVQPDAMIGVTLLAPCQADERVVLKHAGLAVTERTSPSGALTAVVPALMPSAEVEVAFANGDRARGTVVVPDFGDTQRFAVQWQDRDSFQLHAFENGARYNGPGHISAAFTGTAGTSGMVTVLGDATVDLPLLAEVYTFGPARQIDLVLEAAVTESTCNREILGEALLARAGKVEIVDLTLAMPGCDAVGDILVLKNLLQDMTLAAAN